MRANKTNLALAPWKGDLWLYCNCTPFPPLTERLSLVRSGAAQSLENGELRSGGKSLKGKMV